MTRISVQLLMVLAFCNALMAVGSDSGFADETQPALTPVPDQVLTEVVPFLTKYCADCHNPDDPKSGLDLAPFRDELSILKERRAWIGIQRMLRSAEMPPKESLQPTGDERQKLISVIDTVLNKVNCDQIANPGIVTIRRLNRLEYNNTIRDLMGVQLTPADDFPADDIGYGFDHIGDVLSLPPVLFEKYFAAAEKIATVSLREGEIGNGPIRRYLSREMLWIGPGNAPERGNYGRFISDEGELRAEFDVATAADYVANVRALCIPKFRIPFQLEVRIDGVPVKVLEYSEMQVKTHQVRMHLPAGHRVMSVAVIKTGEEPIEPAVRNEKVEAIRKLDNFRTPRLLFEYIDLQGPIDESPTLSEQLILVRQPKPDGSDETACFSTNVRELVRRAFRRPITDDEVAPYLDLYSQRRIAGDSSVRSMQVVIAAVLVSPSFLFRHERDAASDSENGVRNLTDHELATRLSYFLWSTMPDDELFDLADAGTLHAPEVLKSQVRRMLADPRRKNLVENFTGQWLQLRNLEILNPDQSIFPEFDSSLRQSMRRETELFFEYLIHEDRSVLEMLDADYTFANQRLAKHYGLKIDVGDSFEKVTLPNEQRGGVLTQGSILTVTSNPTRTSAVKRGKWVLENILGSAPPPPPPIVDPLDESAAAKTKGSLRERMEQHRSKAGCASCHHQMDPLGFGLENFDGIGRWRTMDGEFPIDASGDLPSGESFKTPKELRQILVAHQEEFARCLTEKMLTYALGRGLEYYDRCSVDRIVEALKQNDYRFSVLIDAIVRSEPFRRRGNLKGQQ